jgi:histidyl-tRNA synthetase
MTSNAKKTPINSTYCSNSTAQSNASESCKHKRKKTSRRTLLHWYQIPRANAPNKLLQEKAVNLLSAIVSKLQNKEEVVLNHSHLIQITKCKKDQNVNLLKQLDDILGIKFHATITIRGSIYYNCYVIQHTEAGRAIIENASVLLAQHYFLGTKSVAPKKQELGGDNGNA